VTRPDKPKQDRDERREEALRPSRYLGYNRDTMGMYFLEREAFELAEAQFRRAVWLNPYEPWFKVHWAAVLLRLHRLDQAKVLLAEALRAEVVPPVACRLWQQYWPGEHPQESTPLEKRPGLHP
jgi:hypothetical protein